MNYKFATDSEVGTIEAADYAAACAKLDAMLTAAAVYEGAWGWVEDEDGSRYEINC
jgi:hypothetical protein